MKKKGVILLVVLLLLAVPIFAQNSGNRNIWNGLHTGMTEEQALTRVREIVGNYSFELETPHPHINRNRIGGLNSNSRVRMFVAISELDYSFSQGLTIIRLETNNPVYGMNPNSPLYKVMPRGYPPITLSFYNEKLVAVGVIWSTSDETRNQMLRQQFGTPKYNESFTFSNSIVSVPAWEVSGLFVATNYDSPQYQILFVDISSFRNAVNDDTRKKRQSSGIQF